MRHSLLAIIAIGITLFLVLSCGLVDTGDNLFDPANPNYRPPTLVIDSAALALIDTIATDRFALTVRGNLPECIIRWRFDSMAWSDWTEENQDSVTIEQSGVSEGTHTLAIQASYDATDTLHFREKVITIVRVLTPVVNTNKISVNGAADYPCTLSVAALGSAPLSYQWYKDSVLLKSQTDFQLIFPSLLFSDSGAYTCIVTNPWGKMSSGKITLSVAKTNYAPVWAKKVLVISVPENSVHTVYLSDSCSDKNGDILTFTMDTSTVPTDSLSANGVYFISPGYTDSGSWFTKVSVSDGEETAQVTIQVNIVNVNRPPVFVPGTPQNKYVIEEGALLRVPFKATDPDGDPVKITLKSTTLPRKEAIVFLDSVLTWQSNINDDGLFKIVLEAADGMDSRTVQVDVGVGDAGSQDSQLRPVALSVVAQAQASSTYKITISGLGMDTIRLQEDGGQPINISVPVGRQRLFYLERYDSLDVLTDTGRILVDIEEENVIRKDDITITLKSAIRTFDVTFDFRNGTADSTVHVDSGRFVAKLADPKRDGYTFDGWYLDSTDGALWDFTRGKVVTDTVLYAKWNRTMGTPAIATHPVNQSVTAGQSATFTVVAEGTNLVYQWQRGTTDIAKADSSSYTTPLTTMDNNGATYRCIVSNPKGSDTSQGATLTVMAQVFVIAASVTGSGGTISPSGNVTVTQGASQAFTITPDIGYSISSVLVDGSTDNVAKTAKQKTFTNVTAAHTIAVSFVIKQYTLTTGTSTDFGTVNATIIRNPSQSLYDSNSTVALTAQLDDARYTFTGWSGGGLSATTDTTTILLRQNTTVTANYTIKKYTLDTSVTPSGSGTITLSPATGPYNHGTSVTLTATPAAGYGHGSWGGVSSGGTVNPVTVTMDGAKSVTATFTLLPPTVIDPSNVTVNAGQTATFTVTAQGAGTLTYQWQRRPSGGTTFSPINGANSASYSTTATIDDNGAAYRCVVSNGAQSVSNAATLTVHYGVQIATQPTEQTAIDNGNVTFTIAATGNPAPSYQWQRGVAGSYSDIDLATAATYTFPVNCPAHFGTTYRCVVTNTVNSVISSEVALTIVVKDADNNTYNIVKIGDQFWTKENLKTTRYANMVPISDRNENWPTDITPAYCWYGKSIENKEIYGALYNWHAVAPLTQEVFIEGWHVPTDAEALWSFLGGAFYGPGGALKENSATYWKSPNANATNSSDFTALPGGYRDIDGVFSYQSEYFFMWCATTVENDANSAYCRHLAYNDGVLDRHPSDKKFGFSIRLVRNN